MTETNKDWRAVFWHERFDDDEERIVYVVAPTEEEASGLAWDELAELMDGERDETIDDYYMMEIAETPKERRFKVRLEHSLRDDSIEFTVLAWDEDEAAKRVLSQLGARLGSSHQFWDVWNVQRVADGGKRAGAGRPPGRKTKPIRVPLENIDKVEKLDIVLDILREWKHRSSLNDKSARFYFLDQALKEIEEHWEKL